MNDDQQGIQVPHAGNGNGQHQQTYYQQQPPSHQAAPQPNQNQYHQLHGFQQPQFAPQPQASQSNAPQIGWAPCGQCEKRYANTLCDSCSVSLCLFCALRRPVCYHGYSGKSQYYYDFELMTMCRRCYDAKVVPTNILKHEVTSGDCLIL